MESLQELTKGKLSPEIIENLKKADPQEMRDMLSQLLPDEDVESIETQFRSRTHEGLDIGGHGEELRGKEILSLGVSLTGKLDQLAVPGQILRRCFLYRLLFHRGCFPLRNQGLSLGVIGVICRKSP